MSLSLIAFQPAIELPSNMNPSVSWSTSISPDAMVKCCHFPFGSVKRRSIQSISSSLMRERIVPASVAMMCCSRLDLVDRCRSTGPARQKPIRKRDSSLGLQIPHGAARVSLRRIIHEHSRSGAKLRLSHVSGLPIFAPMPASQLNTDVVLGVAIPSRNARGRYARLGPVIDAILAKHRYPPVIEKLLAEAVTLTALLGSLLKEPQGQLTLQAQTSGGALDLMVCDFKGGELRGYVRHDGVETAALPEEPSLQELFGEGYLANTFDQPLANERYQGIVPLEGKRHGDAARRYYGQSEQIPRRER